MTETPPIDDPAPQSPSTASPSTVSSSTVSSSTVSSSTVSPSVAELGPPYCTAAARERFERRSDERAENGAVLHALRRGKDVDWRQLEQPSRLLERGRLLGIVQDSASFFDDPRTVGERILEKIIAKNDLLDVLFLERGQAASKSIGRLRQRVSGGTKVGTGFLVAPRVMITNEHVIASPKEARATSFELDYYLRHDGSETGPTQTFRLRPKELFVADAGLDFALVAVEPVNRERQRLDGRGFHPLLPHSGKAIIGERVNIIQHPAGLPQKVCVHDNTLVDVVEDFVHYRTDTQGGSSGSPVFNNQWSLVALHHAAFGGLNEGVRVSRIVARLRERVDDGLDDAASALLATVLSPPEGAVLGPSPTPAGPRFGHPSSEIRGAGAVGGSRPGGVLGPELRDGRAHWTVPLHVRVDLGAATGGGLGRGDLGGGVPGGGDLGRGKPGDGDPGSSVQAPDPPASIEDDPRLGDALDQLDRADQLPYYSPAVDAEARAAYYPEEVLALDGVALFEALSSLTRRHHTRLLDYRQARYEHLYPWVDRRSAESRELLGVYSHRRFEAEAVIRRDLELDRQLEARVREAAALGALDEDFLVRLEAELVYNCEHVVPQSWFRKRLPQRADLHHLFTSEVRCNGFRGNHAFFEFADEAVREGCGRQEPGKFEPLHSKAAVARATLYFLLRYPGEIADSAREMPADRIDTLLAWHRAAAPDLWELHRNAEIAKVQGNRNPFVDHPGLAERVPFSLGLA